MTSNQQSKKPGLALHWKILIGLTLGVIVGICINRYWTGATWSAMGVGAPADFVAHKENQANDGATWIALVSRFGADAAKLIGDLFLRGLRFIAVPIVLFTLISAVAGLGDLRRLGRLGGKTIAIFFATAIAACLIGLSFAATIRPGERINPETRARVIEETTSAASGRVASARDTAGKISIRDQILNAVPANPFAAIAQAEMLQVVTLSVLIGLGLTMVPAEKTRTVIVFCEAMSEAVLHLVRLLMHAAPYAVFALITPIVASLGLEMLKALAVYTFTSASAQAVVLLVVYPVMMILLTPRTNRVGYRRFFRAMAPAQLLAFSSSSSAATLPVNIECCRDRLGVREDVAGFVCSLGTTINMDGTAAYQCVAVVFLAQLYGIPLSGGDYFTIGLLAALISIGSPGLPGASIALMVVVLDAIGIPNEGIAVILAVDRLLDMTRTIINVSGDAACAAVVASSEGKLLTPEELASGRTGAG